MVFHGRVSCCRKQSGQAIPIGIAAILFITILTFALFNTSIVTSEKMRLSNTADAAAYSGLVWQARALNFQAYSNRTMVANQVAIAQIVSFVSWSEYAKIATTNLNALLGWIPIVGQVVTAMRQAAQSFNQAMKSLAPPIIAFLDGMNEVMSGAQKAVYATASATTLVTVREVVKANDENHELSNLALIYATAKNTDQWFDFSEEFERRDRIQRKADVIMRSRDQWSRSRDWKWDINPLISPWAYMMTGFPFKDVDIYLRKAGSTRLYSKQTQRQSDAQQWEWKAKDTLSFHLKYQVFGCKRFRCKWRRRHTEIPLGWGAAMALSNTQNDLECSSSGGGFFGFRRRCNAWSENRRADRLAESMMERVQSYNGVRSYYDTIPGRDLELVVEVIKRGGNVNTSTKAGIGSRNNAEAASNGMGRGMFRVNDNFAGNRVSAVSKAEVYFERPTRRRDGMDEEGNLFNPYWEVRLVEAEFERALAWAEHGVIKADNVEHEVEALFGP